MPEPEDGAIQSVQPDIAAQAEQQTPEEQQSPPPGSIGALFAEPELTQPKVQTEELPAKFQGKTVHDVAKSAIEAEKAMHAKAQEASELKKQLETATQQQAVYAQQQQQQLFQQQQQQIQQQSQSQQAQNYIKQLSELQYTDSERYNTEMLRIQADLAEAKTRVMMQPIQQFMAQAQAQQVGNSLVQAVMAHPQYQAFKDIISQEAIFQDPTVQRELADITSGAKPLNQINLGYLANVVLGTAAMQNPSVLEGQFKQFTANQAQAKEQARSLSAPVGVSRTGSSPASALSPQQLEACKAMGITPADFAKYMGQV